MSSRDSELASTSRDVAESEHGGSSAPSTRGERLRFALRADVDAGSLAVFRMVFGAIVTWGAWRALDSGHVAEAYGDPSYLFRWWLFEWVRPLPGIWLSIAFVAIGIAAAFVTVGLFYRVATVFLAAGVAYWFLLEKADYLNHMYLSVLLSCLLVLVPAHTSLSIDAVRNRWRTRSVPSWTVWLLRFQVGVPYFYAGVAKINSDWLVRAEPLRRWVSQHTDFPVIGPFLDDAAVAQALAWASMVFDLTIVFFLLNRRTRTLAYGVALGFHFMNSRLFDIGIFPWIMIAATTIFFDPDWPKRMASAVRSSSRIRFAVIGGFGFGFLVGGFLPRTFVPLRAFVGGFGVAVLAFHLFDRRRAAHTHPTTSHRHTVGKLLLAFVAVWVVVQLLVPLRHWVIPGNVAWTGEGQRFSWQMLLNDKRSVIGIRITDPATGETWREDYSQHLTPFQVRRFGTNDLILQFAHHLEDIYRKRGIDDIEVRVRARVSLNGRDMQWMIDRRVDLTQEPRPYIPPADWIVPLEP